MGWGALQLSSWDTMFTTAPLPEQADVILVPKTLEIMGDPLGSCGCLPHGAPFPEETLQRKGRPYRHSAHPQ